MSPVDRVERFRKQVADCEAKAASARSEETRRAWLICARGWRSMLEKEELKYLDEPASTLIPAGSHTEIEDALRELVAKSR